MVDVFISYSRSEREKCEVIAKKLEALGLEVWFDARLQSGMSFDKEIENTVRTAKAVLVLWSKASVASEWVRAEATIGKERDVLVAARIEPCTVPLAFTNVQAETLHIDRLANNDPSWLNLIKRIGALCRRLTIADYSRALGDSAEILKRWAQQNSGDPLSLQADALIDNLLGVVNVQRSINWLSIILVTTLAIITPLWLGAGLYLWRDSGLIEGLYRTLGSLHGWDDYYDVHDSLREFVRWTGAVLPLLFFTTIFHQNVAQLFRSVFRGRRP